MPMLGALVIPLINQFEYTPHTVVAQAGGCWPLVSQFGFTQDGTDGWTDTRPMLITNIERRSEIVLTALY